LQQNDLSKASDDLLDASCREAFEAEFRKLHGNNRRASLNDSGEYTTLYAREQELSEQQKGSLELGMEVNKTRRGR